MPIKEKNNVSDQDKRLMQTWGRYFARDNERASLESAAEYYALADNNDEAATLFFWWEEGVRNNSMSQYDTQMCHSTLHVRALEILMESGIHIPTHLRDRADYLFNSMARFQ